MCAGVCGRLSPSVSIFPPPLARALWSILIVKDCPFLPGINLEQWCGEVKEDDSRRRSGGKDGREEGGSKRMRTRKRKSGSSSNVAGLPTFTNDGSWCREYGQLCVCVCVSVLPN